MKRLLFVLPLMAILFNGCSKEEDTFFQEKAPNYKLGGCNFQCPNGFQTVSGIICPGNGLEVCFEPHACKEEVRNSCQR